MLSKLSKWSGRYFARIYPKQPVARMSLRSSDAAVSPLKAQHLIKPFAFTLTLCGSSFVVATVWQYESRKSDLTKYSMFANGMYKINKNKTQNDQLFPMVKQWWNSQTDGFKVFLGLALLNGLVFCGWRVPRLYPFMNRYFVSSIAETKSIRCLPMVFSNFSHFSPFHLGLNMMVLYSFSNLGVHLFGKEHFLALYLSSGVVSTFASYAYKVAVHSLVPSLGASGAILGILAATCIERPDIQLMIIFLPFFSFSSATALKGLILMDSLGLVLRWGFFDHAAHLGGTLFGVYYSYELKKQITYKQATVIKYWNDFKQKF